MERILKLIQQYWKNSLKDLMKDIIYFVIRVISVAILIIAIKYNRSDGSLLITFSYEYSVAIGLLFLGLFLFDYARTYKEDK